MTTTDLAPGVAVDRIGELEAKIDRLTEQMTILTADAEHRRRERESFDDLTGDLSRVSHDAMALATRELETLSQTVDVADLVNLLRHLAEAAPTLDRLVVGLLAAAELVEDAAPLGTDLMSTMTERLAEVDRKGYFTFVTAAVGVVDRVVTNFDERDVELLGDNVVAILEVLREVTQPEMLVFLRRMLDAVQHEQAAVEAEAASPPSLWSLVRQLRDPDVRRGMNRALHTLRSVSVETGPATSTSTSTSRGDNP